jgi:hypothetical protein
MTGAHLGAAPHALRHAVMTDLVRVVVPPQLDLVVCRWRGLAEGDDAREPGRRGRPQVRLDTQKAPTTAHVGQAVLLVNGGPPLRLALIFISASMIGRNPAEPGVAATPQSATLVSVAAGFRTRELEGEPPYMGPGPTTAP